MARLTWQSVAAPDFNTAIAGREIAAKLLGQAASGAGTALGNFQTDQAQLADKAVAIEMAKYTDPAAYEAARAAGLITTAAGVRPDQLSSAGLASLGARTGALQTQVKSQFDFTQSMAAAERAEATRLAEEAAKPDMLNIVTAKTPEQRDAALAAAIQKHPNLPIDSVQKLISMGKGAVSAAREDRDDTFEYEGKTYDRTKLRTSDADRKSGRQMALEIAQTPGMTEELAAKEITRRGGTPGQISEALYGLKEYGYNNVLRPLNLDAPISPADYIAAASREAGEAEGSTAGYNAFLGTGKYAPPPSKPVSDMTLGEAAEYGETLKAATKGKGYAELGPEANKYGSSALGAFQITNQTRERYAKLLYGDNWKNVKFDAKTQDEMGEAIYNDAKDGNINAVFQGIKNTTPGAYKNIPWSVAKKEISLKESGRDVTTPTQDRQFAVSANISKAAKIMQIDGTGIVGEYASYINDKRDVSAVADELIKTKFQGKADRGFIVNQLTDIAQKTNGSFAQAGVILARSLDGGVDTPVIGGMINGVRSWGNKLGGEVFVNPKKLDANINMAANLKVEDQVFLKTELEGAEQRLTAAMANKTAVQNQLANVRARGGNTAEYERRVATAQRLLDAAKADAAQLGFQPERPLSASNAPPPARRVAAQINRASMAR